MAVDPPQSYTLASSLVIDIGQPDFPDRMSVEIVWTDKSLTETEQREVRESVSLDTPTDTELEELTGARPDPAGGGTVWFEGSKAVEALASLARYSVDDAGYLLGFLNSSQVRVPLTNTDAATWPTLPEALQMAPLIALAPTVAGAHGPRWSLVAARPNMLFIVRTVEAQNRRSDLAEEVTQQARTAFGL